MFKSFQYESASPVELQALAYSYFSGNQTLIYGKFPLMWVYRSQFSNPTDV